MKKIVFFLFVVSTLFLNGCVIRYTERGNAREGRVVVRTNTYYNTVRSNDNYRVGFSDGRGGVYYPHHQR
jgi:KaiC/GvpD/RAD55 family RecA-like ATPase